jgi:hypothetical protein
LAAKQGGSGRSRAATLSRAAAGGGVENTPSGMTAIHVKGKRCVSPCELISSSERQLDSVANKRGSIPFWPRRAVSLSRVTAPATHTDIDIGIGIGIETARWGLATADTDVDINNDTDWGEEIPFSRSALVSEVPGASFSRPKGGVRPRNQLPTGLTACRAATCRAPSTGGEHGWEAVTGPVALASLL